MIKENRQPLFPEGNGRRRLRLAAAFIAGMAVTAILAPTPAVSRLLSPGVIQEPALPGNLQSSDRPDTSQPPEPIIGELVGVTNHDSVPSCGKDYPGRQPATQPV